jgi:hypothetical protein
LRRPSAGNSGDVGAKPKTQQLFEQKSAFQAKNVLMVVEIGFFGGPNVIFAP